MASEDNLARKFLFSPVEPANSPSARTRRWAGVSAGRWAGVSAGRWAGVSAGRVDRWSRRAATADGRGLYFAKSVCRVPRPRG